MQQGPLLVLAILTGALALLAASIWRLSRKALLALNEAINASDHLVRAAPVTAARLEATTPKLTLSNAMRPILCCLLFCLGAFAGVPVFAADQAVLNGIKQAIERNTQGKVPVDSVRPSAIPALYEVVSGHDILYVDASGRYGIEGQLLDMLKQRDLTSERRDQLTRINFETLPLELALKTVRGNGKRVLAVFEDPGCPVCRVLTKFIDQLPDVTVYTFMYPVTSPESLPQAQAAWCASDRRGAWATLMRGGPAPRATLCDLSGLARIQQLGDQLRIDGTPTVFLGNGRRLVGATPPDQFIAALDEASR